jgi:hypothetical protein
MIFPSFLAWVSVSSNNLLTNRKNLFVEKFALFEKVQIHGKDWEDTVRKGGMPDSRCWQFSSILTYFRGFSRVRLT